MAEMIKDRLNEIINEIDRYYWASFKTHPKDCTPLIISLTARINEVLPRLSEHEMHQVLQLLKQLLLAMQNGDFVAVKDCLWYELKPALLRMAQRHKNT